MKSDRIQWSPSVILKQAVRFLGVGALNTGVTFLVYQVLLFYLTPSSAYMITWAIGFLIVVVFYPRAVFDTAATNAQRFSVAVAYLVAFLIGLGALNGTIVLFDAPRFAIIVALIATTIFNFVAMRAILVP